MAQVDPYAYSNAFGATVQRAQSERMMRLQQLQQQAESERANRGLALQEQSAGLQREQFNRNGQQQQMQADEAARAEVGGWARSLLSRQDVDEAAKIGIAQQAASNPQAADLFRRAGIDVSKVDWNQPQQIMQGLQAVAGWGAPNQTQMRPAPVLETKEGPYGSKIVTYGDNLQIIKDPNATPEKEQKAPTGYEWGPGGALRPVQGGPADPNSTGTQRSASTQLRKEFNNLPQVKDYRLVLPLFERANTAPDTRAGDISIIYALGKMFDPGSVVREGELTLSQNASPWLQKLAANVSSQVARTGRVDATTRAEIMTALQGQIEALRSPYELARADYEGYAQDYGIDPGLILGTDPGQARQPNAQAAPSDPGVPTATGPNGQKLILLDGQWKPYDPNAGWKPRGR